MRWPRVGLGNLERFAEALDDWFGRDGTPLWITEYGHETRPAEPLGIDPSLQARYAEDALVLATKNPRVRVFLWFVFGDRAGTLWQSGLVAADGSAKPALARFAETARRVDGRSPLVAGDVQVVRLPALELAFHTPAGTPVDVTVEQKQTAIPLEPDGWIDVPIDGEPGDELVVEVTDPFGHTVLRTVQLEGRETVELN